MTQVSIVVPAFNEECSLAECHRRLTAVLARCDVNHEIIFVNDGSTDGTLSLLRELSDRDPHVSLIDLSRNFGKEVALTAGLDVAGGDAVIVIDADLQDPPELIPDLLREWRAGFDVVYARRTARHGETILKRSTAAAFYMIMRRMSRVAIPPNTGDFRLMSKRAVLAVREFREQHRFMKGIFAWIGFPQTAVHYERDARFAGRTTFNYWKLWNFALEGITSFTTIPLRFATYIGLVTALSAFAYGGYIIVRTLFHGNPVPGYPSLVVIMLFLGGIQLTAIGIVGEYLGRVFNESKRRPLYFVNSYRPSRAHQQDAALRAAFSPDRADSPRSNSAA